ncbi:PTS sugar transporter subunit IIB [Raineyella sp. LH-20]|uniref:PTS sugar transporter subunit IIB n=1 Tax=Raineyella sp. LH-20 TaxID=3081204 RepID=UPI002954E9F4|nr:PTS sugar transporter subunit IIB [Raineyella sp. LH-20]WOP19399.1 PTS sugar transporter subunit IIB [Raineyella sp. LH-20]
MKVLLLCNAGMSTSLLTNKMRQNAGPGDEVDAVPESELPENIAGVDVILLGPQIRYKLREVQAYAAARGVKVGIVDTRAYGMMDGKAALAQARALHTGQ